MEAALERNRRGRERVKARAVNILGIDPGTTESGVVVYATGLQRVLMAGNYSNHELRNAIHGVESRAGMVAGFMGAFTISECVIEIIAGRNQRAGQETFNTAHWSGVFGEAWRIAACANPPRPPRFLYRHEVGRWLGLPGRSRKDADIRGELIFRFGPTRQQAVGTKRNPGPLYGVKKDAWQALGVVIAWLEKLQDGRGNENPFA